MNKRKAMFRFTGSRSLSLIRDSITVAATHSNTGCSACPLVSSVLHHSLRNPQQCSRAWSSVWLPSTHFRLHYLWLLLLIHFYYRYVSFFLSNLWSPLTMQSPSQRSVVSRMYLLGKTQNCSLYDLFGSKTSHMRISMVT